MTTKGAQCPLCLKPEGRGDMSVYVSLKNLVDHMLEKHHHEVLEKIRLSINKRENYPDEGVVFFELNDDFPVGDLLVKIATERQLVLTAVAHSKEHKWAFLAFKKDDNMWDDDKKYILNTKSVECVNGRSFNVKSRFINDTPRKSTKLLLRNGISCGIESQNPNAVSVLHLDLHCKPAENQEAPLTPLQQRCGQAQDAKTGWVAPDSAAKQSLGAIPRTSGYGTQIFHNSKFIGTNSSSLPGKSSKSPISSQKQLKSLDNSVTNWNRSSAPLRQINCNPTMRILSKAISDIMPKSGPKKATAEAGNGNNGKQAQTSYEETKIHLPPTDAKSSTVPSSMELQSVVSAPADKSPPPNDRKPADMGHETHAMPVDASNSEKANENEAPLTVQKTQTENFQRKEEPDETATCFGDKNENLLNSFAIEVATQPIDEDALREVPVSRDEITSPMFVEMPIQFEGGTAMLELTITAKIRKQ